MTGTMRIHHVTIMVTDLTRARAFYGEVLGLRELPRPNFPSLGIWYDIDGLQIHIILTQEVEPPSARHIAFEVDDLEATLTRVAQMGLPIWDDIQFVGWSRKHCRDPFGNGIELLECTEASLAPPAPSNSYVDTTGKWHLAADETKSAAVQ